MTANSVNLVNSAPFTGLKTLTFNIPTTGIYTFGWNITLPWVTSDQAFAVANPEAAEVQTITCVADSAGSLNNKYFVFYTDGNINGYYVWYNINSAGTDPAVAGLTGIEVDGATNATATTLGGATRTAIAAAVSQVAVTGSTSAVIITNKQYGNCTAAVDTGTTGFTLAVGTTGTYGYATGLQVVLKNGSTVLSTQNRPAPTQPLWAGSVRSQCTAADVITLVTSSLAAADAVPNAVKGIFNIWQGE